MNIDPLLDQPFGNDFSCRLPVEHCTNCGRTMVESVEPTGRRSSETGEPLFDRWHSCPTWVTGWRTRIPAVFLPGYGHDSHHADLPLAGRGYS